MIQPLAQRPVLRAGEDIKSMRERFIELKGVLSQGDGVARIAVRMIGPMVIDGYR